MTNTKNKVFSIGILLVLVVSMLCLSLVGCSSQNVPTETETPTVITDNETNNFSSEIVSTKYVKLAMLSATAASINGSVSKTLSATVLPATATNKAVDWTVEWADSSNTANVTDYISVTPDSDGSTNATVTCYQAFTGNIVITVTTRQNNYSATCVVSFLGAPTDINLSGAISPYSGNTYDMGIGVTYEFDIDLSNPFGTVGSQFNNFSCSTSGVGYVTLGYMEHYNSSGNDVWYDTSDHIVTLDSLKDNFITASYANGKLIINTIKSIESYYSSVTRLDSGRTRGYNDKFRSFVDDCYFKVIVTENTSGLSKEFNIRFDTSVVTSVSTNTVEMSF